MRKRWRTLKGRSSEASPTHQGESLAWRVGLKRVRRASTPAAPVLVVVR
jgi:hypothetical protein